MDPRDEGDDPLSNSLVPPSIHDALDIERQRLEIERQKLALERERLELDKLARANGPPKQPEPSEKSSGRHPRARRAAPGRIAPPSGPSRAPLVIVGVVVVLGAATLALVLPERGRTEDVASTEKKPDEKPPVEPAPPIREPVEPRDPPRERTAEAPPDPPAPRELVVSREPSDPPRSDPLEVAAVESVVVVEAPKAPEKPRVKSPAVLKAERELARRIVGWLAERRALQCMSCQGKVFIKCSSCAGTGQKEVLDVGAGADNKLKMVPCGTCLAKGTIHCAKCENGISETTTKSIEKRWRICGPWLGSFSEKSVQVEIAEDEKTASARYAVRLAHTDREITEDSTWELDAKGVWQGVEIVVPKKLKSD